MPSLLALPVEDTPDARQATDQALADFETAVSDTGDHLESESDQENALAALAGLDQLRDDIDSRTQTSGPDRGSLRLRGLRPVQRELR